MFKWLLLFISPLLYALPFLAPPYCWWLIFLFPPLFIYTAATYHLSFKEGFFWGLLTFSLHTWGFLYSLIILADGPYALRIVMPGVLLIYLTFCTSFLFWMASCIRKWFSLETPCAKICLYIFMLSLFFLWTEYTCLFALGRFEGYCLMHPLLPLMQQPALLGLMPVVGKNLMLFMWIVSSAWITYITLYVYHLSSRLKVFMFLCALAPWLLSIALYKKEDSPPPWLTTIAYLPEQFSTSLGQFAMPYAIYRFKQLIDKNPELEWIILPESSWYQHEILEQPEQLEKLTAHQLGKPINCIISSFGYEHNHYCNTIYWMYDGKLQQTFHKRHAMPITEEIPACLSCSTLHNLYFNEIPPRQPSANPRPLFCTQNVCFVPYVCSELYFNHKPDDNHPQALILALVNDLWVAAAYGINLLYQAARFKAMAWQRPILYISYTHAAYLAPDGEQYLL